MTTTTKNNCFQVSQIKGRSDRATSFKSDLSTLKKYFTEDMRLYKIRLCGTFQDFDGIQGFVTNDFMTYELTPIGFNYQCEDWEIPRGSRLAKITLAYNSFGVKYIKASTEKNVNFERGSQTASDSVYVVDFDEYEPLTGFVGYEQQSITALGYYRYKCATRPEDLNPTGDDPIVDPIEPVPETEDPEKEEDEIEDTPIDPDENREGITDQDSVDELEKQNESIMAEIKETDGKTVLLVVLLCSLVPLMCILGCVIYSFRKNKVHAERAGIARRNSSMRAMEEKLDSQRKSNEARLFAIDDEKKAGGDTQIVLQSVNNEQPSISEEEQKDDKEEIVDAIEEEVLPDVEAGRVKEPFRETLSGFFNGQQANIVVPTLSKVPSEAEITTLLKGKSKAEKKLLLKEIERAKQAKIHMEYLLEQQKLRHDEKWATRNVEERQAIRNIYGISNDHPTVNVINYQETTDIQDDQKDLSDEQHDNSAEDAVAVNATEERLQPIDEEDPADVYGFEAASHRVAPQWARARFQDDIDMDDDDDNSMASAIEHNLGQQRRRAATHKLLPNGGSSIDSGSRF